MVKGKNSNPVIIGIDLGTSFSAVAWLNWSAEKRYQPDNIKVFEGDFLLPTVIDFSPTTPEVGKRVGYNPDCVITGFQFKSKIGEGVSFSLAKECSRQNVSPEEAAEEVLKFLHGKIEEWFEESVGQEIIWDEVDTTLAIPAFVSSKQADRSNVFRSIAQKAGFPVVRIIEEPIAALLDVDRQEPGVLPTQDQIILLLDYGGGTCDVAIVRTGYRRIFWRDDKGKILGVASELCGGQFIDRAIANWLQQKGYQEEDKHKLMQFARDLKEKLSREGDSNTNENLIYKEFEQLSKPIVERMYEGIESALEEAERQQNGKTIIIDKVVLTGGGSQHPLVRKLISEYFKKVQGQEPNIILAPDPQLNVSRGAALYGFYQTVRHEMPIYAESAYDLILVFPNGVKKKLVRRGQRIPFKKPNRFAFQVIRATDVVILSLYRRGENGREEEYAQARLEFPQEIPPGQILNLSIEVDLRGYVYIYGSIPPSQRIAAETIIRIPLF